jgi:hypothetical protein
MSTRQRKNQQTNNRIVRNKKRAAEDRIGTLKHVLMTPWRYLERVPLLVRVTAALTLTSLAVTYYVPSNTAFETVLRYSSLN